MTHELSPASSEPNVEVQPTIRQLKEATESFLDSPKTLHSFRRQVHITHDGNGMVLFQDKPIRMSTEDEQYLELEGPEARATDDWFEAPEPDAIFPFGLWADPDEGIYQHSVFHGTNDVQQVYDIRTREEFPCPEGDAAAEARRADVVSWFMRHLRDDSVVEHVRVRYHKEDVLDDAQLEADDPYEIAHISQLRPGDRPQSDYPANYYQFKLKTARDGHEHKWLVVGEDDAVFVTTDVYDPDTREDVQSRQSASEGLLRHVAGKLIAYVSAE